MTVASDIELGFTSLTGVKYGHHHEGTPDFLDQTLSSSFHFGFTPIGILMRAGKKNHSHFQLGMQYSVDNIRLSNPTYTVRNADRLLVPVALDEPAKKSKLRYTTLGLVLRYNWRPVDKLRISVSTHYDFLMNSYAITKKPKEKNDVVGFRSVPVRRRHLDQLSLRRVLRTLFAVVAVPFVKRARSADPLLRLHAPFLTSKTNCHETSDYHRITPPPAIAVAGAKSRDGDILRPLRSGRGHYERCTRTADDADDERTGRPAG